MSATATTTTEPRRDTFLEPSASVPERAAAGRPSLAPGGCRTRACSAWEMAPGRGRTPRGAIGTLRNRLE